MFSSSEKSQELQNVRFGLLIRIQSGARYLYYFVGTLAPSCV